MKSNFYKKNLFLIFYLFFLPFISKAVTVTDSAAAANVQVCLKREIVRMQFSVGGTGTTGSYLEVKLPTGFTFEGIAYFNVISGGANTATYAGLQGNGRHRITFANSTASSTLSIGIWQKANCSAGTSSFTTRDSLFFWEGVGPMNASATNLFNGTAPDLSITSVSNSPEPSVAGSTVTRTYTVTNGGFGATTNFRIIDNYFNGGISINNGSFRINPSGANYNIGGGQITNNGDSVIIRFRPTEIQNIGDGDTLFENGESFVLQYTFSTNNCGNGSNQFPGVLSVNWMCPGSTVCATQSAIYTNSVTIPAGPNITTWGKRAATLCTNGIGFNVDTVYVRNTGGLATDVNLTLNNTWNSSSFDPAHGGYWDTANIFYKRGRNGTPIRFYIQAGTITNGSSCGISGVARATFRALTISTNDTIIIIIPRRTLICQQTTCATSTGVGYPGFSGLAIGGNFKNACASSTFNLSATQVVPLQTYQLMYTNVGNNDFNCGQNGQLIYSFPFLGTQLPRTKLTFEVTLPPSLSLNSVFGVIAYLSNGSTTIYPNQISGNNFIFNGHGNRDGYSLYINVTGSSSNAYCSGLVPVYLRSFFNPDTANGCNTNYPVGCLLSRHNFFGCGTNCCTEGLYTLSLSAYRENVGIRDNNNDGIAESGKADTTLINRNLFWHNDTLLIKTRALVKTSGLPSFDYAYFKTGLPEASSSWIHIGSNVRHWGPSTSLNTISVTPTRLGDSITYDVSALNNFFNNDTIEMISRFVVNRYGYSQFGLASVSASNLSRWYGSTVANPTPAQRYSCNEFVVNAEITTLAYLSNSSTHTVNGCGQVITSHDMNLTVPSTRFIYEVRRYKIPMSFITRVPAGYTVDSVVYHSNALLANRTKVNFTISGDSIRVNLSTLFIPYGGTMPIQSDDELPYMRMWMKPGCNTPTASISHGARIVYEFPYWNRTLNAIYTSPVYTLNTTMPSFTANSPAPIALQYSKLVSWEVTNTNVTAISAPNGFAYILNNSSFISIDSVKLGNSIITPNGNGFYSLGTYSGTSPNNAKTIRIFARTTGCNLDSIRVFFGFDCSAIPTSFTNNICGGPFTLYVQPQAASIQTQITALSSTPLDPANPSAGNYGGSTIFMCRSIPFEMEIQSSQTGTIYNVSQSLTLPFNGGSGLNYVSDSGYIEYPIGTPPRPFSAAANTALIAQAATGTMTLSLNQIDPDTFNNIRGLLGTGLGTNNTRRAILRWKMRSNCDLVSGDQWQATQSAVSPCGSPAAGSTTTTSGYSFDLDGVTRPYIATVRVSTGLDGCGSQTTQIRLEKTGGAPPQSTDSITIRLPLLVKAGTMTCSGVDCPGGSGSTQAYTVREDLYYQYLTFQYPNTAGGNGDTLLYSFPMSSREKSTCENNQNLKADVYQQLTVYCGAPIPANLCPNAKLSLGSETKSFDIRKAILGFTTHDLQTLNNGQYVVSATIGNTSPVIAADAGLTLKTFLDINSNSAYDKTIDQVIHTKVISTSIAANGSVSFTDTFSASLGAILDGYTVIDTGDAGANCFCGGVIRSGFFPLPINFINISATNIRNNLGKIQWSVNSDVPVEYYYIYRKIEGQQDFKLIGKVSGNSAFGTVLNYEYFDDIKNVSTGRVFYYIKANNESKSDIVSIIKTDNTQAGIVTLMPNPANEVLYVINNVVSTQTSQITITDMSGKVVYTGELNEASTSINTSNFVQGIYSVSVINGDVIETYKLSIVR